MAWVIYRTDPDGSRAVVACVDDQCEIGVTIDEDRKKIDFEARYEAKEE